MLVWCQIMKFSNEQFEDRLRVAIFSNSLRGSGSWIAGSGWSKRKWANACSVSCADMSRNSLAISAKKRYLLTGHAFSTTGNIEIALRSRAGEGSLCGGQWRFLGNRSVGFHDQLV